MLNFTGNQNQINPNPNNCCGGFALAAVVNQLNLNGGLPALPALPDHAIINATLNPDNILGITTYLAIQNIQDNFAAGGPQENFVNNIGPVHGTRRSLPSAIVITAIMAGIGRTDITVHYDSIALLALGFPANVIAAEINMLTRLGITLHNTPGLVYAAPGANEFDIILCNGGGHWISDDNADYYNPDDGTNNNNLAGIPAIFSDLYIRIG